MASGEKSGKSDERVGWSVRVFVAAVWGIVSGGGWRRRRPWFSKDPLDIENIKDYNFSRIVLKP